jgi:uncharacterized coiled-coil DUF342 family protein
MRKQLNEYKEKADKRKENLKKIQKQLNELRENFNKLQDEMKEIIKRDIYKLKKTTQDMKVEFKKDKVSEKRIKQKS